MKTTIFTYFLLFFLSFLSVSARYDVGRDSELDGLLLRRYLLEVLTTRDASWSAKVAQNDRNSALGQKQRLLPAWPTEPRRQRTSLSPGREPGTDPVPEPVKDVIEPWQLEAASGITIKDRRLDIASHRDFSNKNH